MDSKGPSKLPIHKREVCPEDQPHPQLDSYPTSLTPTQQPQMSLALALSTHLQITGPVKEDLPKRYPSYQISYKPTFFSRDISNVWTRSTL